MAQFTLPNEAKLVEALAPATDAAGRNAAKVSLKNASKAYIIAHIAQGNAATITLTPQQAQDVAGTGAKALSAAVPIWSNLDTAASDALVRRADAVSYTTDAAVKNKIVVFEINPAQFDLDNGFDCLFFSTGASNVANLTQAEYLLTDLRYQQATSPSATAD